MISAVNKVKLQQLTSDSRNKRKYQAGQVVKIHTFNNGKELLFGHKKVVT